MSGLFTLLIVSFDAQNVFNVDEFQFVYFFFCCLCLWGYWQCHEAFALHFLNEFYIFSSYISTLDPFQLIL